MSDITNTLPEIAESLFEKGFSIEISDDHNSITVSLNRPVRYSEIEAAVGYEFPASLQMRYNWNGSIVISER